MVAALGDEYDFRIVTSDRDLGDKLAFPDVRVGAWTKVGKADVLYDRVDLSWVWRCRKILNEVRPDVLYVNSFFGRPFSMAAMLAWHLLPRTMRPVRLLAPRGEFSRGATRFKRLRKQAFIRFVKVIAPYEQVLWHASSVFEAEDIRRALGSVTELTVANPIGRGAEPVVLTASDLASWPVDDSLVFPDKPPGTLRIAFLSRIVAIKNLHGTLEIVKTLRGSVKLTVCGPTEDKVYWRRCLDLIAEMPPNIAVEYAGEVEHRNVRDLLRSSDVLLFPTLGENYSHVINEALQAGCPVVISDQTPWRDLAAKGVGWDLPLSDIERFRSALQECVDMGTDEFRMFRNKVADYGKKASVDSMVLEQNRCLLNLALTHFQKRTTI
jgi:glycosyltransferase involved in cell wall biosynthesis